MRALLLLGACACSGVAVDEPRACDGLLVVEGPVSRVLATFDAPRPTAHLAEPPMRLANSEDGCRRADGCLVFVPMTDADEHRIESWNPETGEPLCLGAIRVERP